MFISKPTLDDLMKAVLEHLLSEGAPISPTRENAVEVSGILLEITNIRGRLSRTETKGKAFSCIGEWLWYLSRSNSLSFIEYYLPAYANESDDGATIYGGYGPRLFDFGGINQIENVITLLRKSPFSRRAVIQIFSAADITHRRTEIPCTCTLQFLVRDELVHLFVNMRSNDAYIGLPHDVFAFTMLQEMIARTLEKGVGSYKHFVGSLHLYDKRKSDAQRYISEGFQATDLVMPEMPISDPWPAIDRLLVLEELIRKRKKVILDEEELDPYWLDIARMLKVYSASTEKDLLEMKRLSGKMNSERYGVYINGKIDEAVRSKKAQKQLPF